MSTYVFIESRNPLDSPDTFLVETATALKKRGTSVTVFLVQNGVLAMRKTARNSRLPQLLEAGITILADDFSVRERGIHSVECHAEVKTAGIDQLVDLLVQENTKAVWQ